MRWPPDRAFTTRLVLVLMLVALLPPRGHGWTEERLVGHNVRCGISSWKLGAATAATAATGRMSLVYDAVQVLHHHQQQQMRHKQLQE